MNAYPGLQLQFWWTVIIEAPTFLAKDLQKKPMELAMISKFLPPQASNSGALSS